MTNYFSKFGIAEYIVFVLGAVILVKQTYSYIIDTLDLTFPHLIVFALGLLLLFAPKYLVKIAKDGINKLTTKKTT